MYRPKTSIFRQKFIFILLIALILLQAAIFSAAIFSRQDYLVAFALANNSDTGIIDAKNTFALNVEIKGETIPFEAIFNESAAKTTKCFGYLNTYKAALKFTDPDGAADFIFLNLTAFANALKQKYAVEYIPTSYSFNSGKISYHQGRDGLNFSKSDFYEAVCKAIDLKLDKVKVELVEKKAEELSSFKNSHIIRGRFSTAFYSSSNERAHNISLAAKKIDGYVLNPGETFSFNEVVGKRTRENGFKDAKVILNGEFTDGVGGGTCQVSTTLYNCALLSDMQIITVNQHSLPVSYVAPSFDAMVSDSADLKFKNTSQAPVTVHSFIKDRNLYFYMIGVKGRDIKLVSETLSVIPYKTQIITTDEVTEKTVKRQGKNGLISQGYIEVFEDGTIKKVKIRKNTYKALDEIILTPKQDLLIDYLP